VARQKLIKGKPAEKLFNQLKTSVSFKSRLKIGQLPPNIQLAPNISDSSPKKFNQFLTEFMEMPEFFAGLNIFNLLVFFISHDLD